MNLWLPRGKAGGKGKLGSLDARVHSAAFKMVNQQGPTYSTAEGTLLNVMQHPGWERNLGEDGHIYMDGWIPLVSI